MNGPLVQWASSMNMLSWNPDKYPVDSMQVSFVLFHLIQVDLNLRLHSAHGVSLIWKILEFDNFISDLDIFLENIMSE